MKTDTQPFSEEMPGAIPSQLSEHHIPFALHGFALINALALAKVVLIARDLHLADRFFRNAHYLFHLSHVLGVHYCAYLFQDC